MYPSSPKKKKKEEEKWSYNYLQNLVTFDLDLIPDALLTTLETLSTSVFVMLEAEFCVMMHCFIVILCVDHGYSCVKVLGNTKATSKINFGDIAAIHKNVAGYRPTQ